MIEIGPNLASVLENLAPLLVILGFFVFMYFLATSD
jgi:hypothetical protein